MPRRMVTANRLRDGAVVYLDHDGGWSERFADGRVVADEEAAAALLREAAKAEDARIVVGPYLIEVAQEDGAPLPLGTRETIRAGGPTVPMGAGALPGAA